MQGKHEAPRTIFGIDTTQAAGSNGLSAAASGVVSLLHEKIPDDLLKKKKHVPVVRDDRNNLGREVSDALDDQEQRGAKKSRLVSIGRRCS